MGAKLTSWRVVDFDRKLSIAIASSQSPGAPKISYYIVVAKDLRLSTMPQTKNVEFIQNLGDSGINTPHL
jgi:hypothetical protein